MLYFSNTKLLQARYFALTPGTWPHVPGVTLGIIDPVDLVPGIHGIDPVDDLVDGVQVRLAVVVLEYVGAPLYRFFDTPLVTYPFLRACAYCTVHIASPLI